MRPRTGWSLGVMTLFLLSTACHPLKQTGNTESEISRDPAFLFLKSVSGQSECHVVNKLGKRLRKSIKKLILDYVSCL